MGKGSNVTSTSSFNAPDPQAGQTYRDILTRAQGVAATPYQAYSGPLTADVNSQQNLGISGINANAGYAAPNLGTASTLARNASNPLTGEQIQSYLNPYTQNVVDTTTQQLQHDNSQQMAQLQGNQISQGALGGNATGVAKGILAGQQGRTLASTTANLYDKGYQGAINTAYQQYQQNPLAAGNALANYGISGQNALLSGAGQQINAGTLQQQTEQQRLNALYQQYAQAQAFPYQQTQWLAGVGTGVGSNLGGTSSGTTTGPPPNQTAQWLGAGLTAASMFLNRGGAVHGYANGGGVAGYAEGGAPGPWGGIAPSWIPTMSIHGGSGAPQAHAPSLPNQPTQDFSKLASGITGLGGKIQNRFSPTSMDWNGDPTTGEFGYSGGVSPMDFTGTGVYARGGSVSDDWAGDPALDDPAFRTSGGHDMWAGDPALMDPGSRTSGGPLSFEERSQPVQQGIAAGTFDPVGANADANNFGGGLGGVAPVGPVPVPKSRSAAIRDEMERDRPTGAPVVASEDDEEEAPASAPRSTSGPASTGVAAFAPSGPGSYGEAPDAITQPRGGFGLGLVSPNAKTGLLTAGLGMLASRSPFLGNAVGEGGLAGVGAYNAANESDRKVAAEALKLSREARKQFTDEAMGVRRQTETERHNKVTEKNAQATADRTKFVPAGQYMGEDGIYRPVAMDQSTGRLVDMGSGKDIPSGAKIQGKGDSGFTDDDARKIAKRYVASGDRTTTMGLGPAAKIKVQRMVDSELEAQKISPEEMAQRTVEFEGRKAGSRTLGTMEAKMGAAAMEAEGAIKLVRGVIERLPRTGFLPFNRLVEGYSKNTLNPDQAELYARTQAIVNTYSAVMSRGANITTDSSRHHAADLLNTAFDAKTFNRILDTIQQEIDMAKQSPARMQQYYREHYGPKSVESGGGSAGAPGASLPPGSGFRPPADALARQFNGKTYYYDPTTKQPYPGQ